MKETPASRFIRASENWIATSASKFGVHTPAMDQRGDDRVIMAAFVFPPNRRKIGLAVIAHLGKLADVLKVTLIVEQVPPDSRDLYADYQNHGQIAVRLPLVSDSG